MLTGAEQGSAVCAASWGAGEGLSYVFLLLLCLFRGYMHGHKPHYTRHWGQQGESKALWPWPNWHVPLFAYGSVRCSPVVRTYPYGVRSLFAARCFPVVRACLYGVRSLFARCLNGVRTVFARCSLVVCFLFARCSLTPNTHANNRTRPPVDWPTG